MFFMFLSLAINAQDNKDISGYYKDSSGAVIKINNNKSFIVIGYATVLTGKWHLKDQYIELVPYRQQYMYGIYGRHEPSLKGSKIMFLGFEENKNLFSEDTRTWISVFNEDPNCFSFPYVKHFQGSFKTLSLCRAGMTGQNLIETAENHSGFNDFIIMNNYRSTKAKTVTYRILNDTLYDLYEDVPLRKTELGQEDLQMFSYIEHEARNFLVNPEKIYANRAYNMEVPDVHTQQYLFDKERNIYVDRFNKEVDSNSPYHDLSIINEYVKIKINAAPGLTADIKSGSLFNAACIEN